MKAVQSKERTTDEGQIQAIIEDYGEGLRNKDADRCVMHYADDVVQFDLAPPLENRGKATARKNLAEWFKTFDGPIGVEITRLTISAGTDAAFAFCLNHISGTNRRGEKNDHWVRVSIGFQKTEGKWLVNHEHVSVPFYMDGSFRAALDLKP
jgi:ketosteroid isomerase-like protein